MKLSQYNKLWVAVGGLAILLALPILSQKLGINFDQQTEVIMNVVISALTAAGVYQVPNKEE